MAELSVENVRIAGVSATVPKSTENSSSLRGISEEDLSLLVRSIGINERRVAPDHLCASDLCLDAASRLIEELNWEKDEIELLIFVTQTPDYVLPGTSMILQNKLGLSKQCMTLDINQGCAGYVYGLSVASQMLSSGSIKKGLLLVGDTITRLIDKDDNSTHPIFSDAGTATALEFDSKAERMFFNLQTDGSGYDAILMKEGGARNPGSGLMRMNGHDVLAFALKEVPGNIERALQAIEIEKDAIDYFVLHQANKLLNDSIRRKLKVDKNKFPVSLDKYGNTSCATIPLTLVSELNENLTNQKLKLALTGFGVGLSWGTAIIHTDQMVCLSLNEME